jgi:transcriptional regulator with XRE-family HTH domain
MRSDDLPLSTDDATAADDTLGGRIVHAREAAGLTTGELAARLGVAAKTVANWESDRAEPRANKLSMLAGLLAVSPTWLLAGRGAAPREGAASGGNGELESEVGRIKAEATRLVQRIDALSAQIASASQRSE